MNKKIVSNKVFLSLFSIAFLTGCIPQHQQPVQTVTIAVTNGQGSGTYNVGDKVTITATIPDHKEFSYWNKDNIKVSEDNPYTFTADKDATYTAIFNNEPNPLDNYTSNVYKDGDKDFKILNLTDIQLHDGETVDITMSVIDQLVEKEKPDMITFLGDILNDHRDYPSVVNFVKVLDKINSLNIPWAPIFGNHDYEDYQAGYKSAKTTTSDDLADLYEEYSNCLFIRGPQDVTGKSNYIVNIKDKTTNQLIHSLYFMDSRLSGLDDTHAKFYRDAVQYSKNLNDGNNVPSTIFSHIAIPEYGEAITISKTKEYRDVIGSINRDPSDLSSGTKLLFPAIKELGVTKTVICGHDHENAYYTNYQGVKLAFSMKSSDGDHYNNPAQIGGSILNINNDGSDFYYSKANIAFASSDSLNVSIDELGYWKYSGATIKFDIDLLGSSGTIKWSLLGTNVLRYSVDEKTRLGMWNRLTSNVEINVANKSINYGSLTHISGSKYCVSVDVATLDLNKGSGEQSNGEETGRLIYVSGGSSTNNYKISNVRIEFEKITETDQYDLSECTIDTIEDQDYNFGQYVRPQVIVKKNGNILTIIDEIQVIYENNIEIGIATVRVVPSGKGAHKYKGEKVTTFKIIDNPDADTMPGHENARLVSASTDTLYKDITPVNNWKNSGKSFYFEIKQMLRGAISTGNTIKFSLSGKNSNPGAVEKPTSDWNRLTRYYVITFTNDSVTVTKNNDSINIATVTNLGDRWFGVKIPYSLFELNEEQGAMGNENETFTLSYWENITRSYKIDKINSLAA